MTSLNAEMKWVAVRYGGDMKTEVLKISKIKHFHPQSSVDFDPTQIFKIKTKGWNAAGNEEVYQGMIEGIGVSKEGAEAVRRAFLKNASSEMRGAVLRKLKDLSPAPVSNTSEGEVVLTAAEQEIEKRQEAQLAATKEIEKKMLQARQHSHARDKTGKGETCSRARRAEVPENIKRMRTERQQKEKEKENTTHNWEHLLLLNRPPSSKSLSVSQSVINSPPSIPQLSLKVAQCESHKCKTCGTCWLDSNSEALSEVKDELLLLKSQVGDIFALLNERHGNKTVPSTYVFGKEVMDGKVTLAQNVTCSEIGWRTMNTCSDTPDWCVALLRGTFGENEAMNYRVIPRYKDCKPFPIIFLDAVKVYYEEFIDRRVKELDEVLTQQVGNKLAEIQRTFFFNNKKKTISQIGAVLSDRAEGIFRAWQRSLTASGLPAPAREKLPKKNTTATARKTVPSKTLTTSKLLQPRTYRTRKNIIEEEGQSLLDTSDKTHVISSPAPSRSSAWSESDLELTDTAEYLTISLEEVNMEGGLFLELEEDTHL